MVLFETYIPNKNIRIGITIVIIIFILYTLIATYIIYYVGYHIIGGFWEADPSFCEESGLDRFYIYIEPPSKGNMCWICMAKSNNSIVNHMTTYNIDTKWSPLDNWTTNIECPKIYTITFNELPENLTNSSENLTNSSENSKEELFPKKQTLKLEIDTGKLYLLNNKNKLQTKVYFVGYKNSRISDLIGVDKKKIDSFYHAESSDLIENNDLSTSHEDEDEDEE